MDVQHGDDNLDRLEADPKFTYGLSQGVIKAFGKRMQLIKEIHRMRGIFIN